MRYETRDWIKIVRALQNNLALELISVKGHDPLINSLIKSSVASSKVRHEVWRNLAQQYSWLDTIKLVQRGSAGNGENPQRRLQELTRQVGVTYIFNTLKQMLYERHYPRLFQDKHILSTLIFEKYHNLNWHALCHQHCRYRYKVVQNMRINAFIKHLVPEIPCTCLH